MAVVELLFLVSMTVGNSSHRTLHSICGSVSIAASLMLHGRLSTLLPRFASLSIRRLLPSALSNVVTPEFSARISNVFFLSQESCMSVFLGLVYSNICLTNVAVGCFLGYCASIILMCLAQSVLFLKKPLHFIIIFIKPILMFAIWTS